MKGIKISLLLILIASLAYSQEFKASSYRKDLNIKLNVIDEKRIDKAVQILNDGLSVEYEGISTLQNMSDSEKVAGTSDEYLRAIKKLLQASEKYKEGHNLIFTVYTENCGKFVDVMKKIQHYASGVNKAKYYEQKGDKDMNKAIRIRGIIQEADKPEWIQYKMHEAIELEKLAIRDYGRALNIFQDFPVEYDYHWDDDVSEDVLAEFYKNPIVNIPPDEVFKKKPKPVEIPEIEKIVFRVQIAAHTVHITDDYIKTFYTGPEKPIEVYEKKWYKYQIGEFDNFASADSLQKSCRVPRAFVVAYQNGQKLSIKDALKIIKNQ